MVELSFLREKFDGLSVRERLMLLLALLAVLYQIADTLLIGGQYAQLQQAQARITAQQQNLAQVATQVAEVSQGLRNDPNTPVRQRNDRIRRRIETRKNELALLADELVAPQQMAVLLERVLGEQKGLELLSLQTQRPQLLNAPTQAEGHDAPKKQSTTFPVFVHGFVVEFSGNYLATLAYLDSLESLREKFYWDRVDFQVIDYPSSRVRLELHTLSLSEDWIGV